MHRHPDPPNAFAELGLERPILKAVQAMGFETPSPIQEALIPLVLKGKDVLGQARTGTGKTAAFGMPTLQMIRPGDPLQMVVLEPTRELAAQVIGEFRRLAEYIDLRCVPVYGGTNMRQQFHQLGRRPHVAVGTPGRVMDMMKRGALRLDTVRFVVLDEVDRMLDIGFRDDIRFILGRITQPHQTIFVSATIDDEINRLAHTYMTEPVEVNVSRDKLTVDEVSQYYCVVDPWDKFRFLKHLLKEEKPRLAIVFCNTKHSVRKLARRLYAAGVNAREIHGDLVQQRREKIMERFRQQSISVLVATDLAARGIDVRDISHIVNFDIPQDREVYIHRIGRTARMGSTGRAITFVSKDEGEGLTEVEKLINQEIQQLVVEGFQPSERPPDRDERGRSGEPAQESAAALAQTTATATATKSAGPNLTGRYPLRRRSRRLR
ncbi:MAG: DEAD/DEAH box helicase [Planctomycetota bacterium]